jgi:hypothetical protein
MWQSAVPCESPQPGRSTTARGDCALAMPRCWYSRLGQGQGSASRSAKGRGWSIREGGLHARRGNASLDEVQKDSLALLGIGDDGEHLHGRAAAAAVKCVYLVDLGQQPRPSRTRFPSGDGRLGTILEDCSYRRGRLLRALLRASAPRAVRARGCRIHGQRELVCHAWIDGPTVRTASLPPSSASITAATGVALG